MAPPREGQRGVAWRVSFCLPPLLLIRRSPGKSVQLFRRRRRRMSRVRGLPHVTSAKLSDFITPTPFLSLSHSRNLCYLRLLFHDPLPPSSADVINGSPLMKCAPRWTTTVTTLRELGLERPRPCLVIICVWIALILPGVWGCTQITHPIIHQPWPLKVSSLAIARMEKRALPSRRSLCVCVLVPHRKRIEERGSKIIVPG